MDQYQKIVKYSLVINVAMITCQYLAVLWLLGPFCDSFRSIFDAMNVDLPTIVSLLMWVSNLVNGFLGWITALLILALGVFAAYKVTKIQQNYIVLPITNALQSFAILLMFIICFCTVIPALTLVSGVG